MSSAGLMTQVLPQTSAGKSFHDGIAMGKFHGRDHAADAHGHADGHGELVLQLGGRGLAEERPPFARHVVGGVDCLLHVAAGLAQHFAHFACHVAGELFLALQQQLAGSGRGFRRASGRASAAMSHRLWPRPGRRRRHRQRPRMQRRRRHRWYRPGSGFQRSCRSLRERTCRRSNCHRSLRMPSTVLAGRELPNRKA